MVEFKVRVIEEEKLFSQLWFKNYGLVVLGSALLAVGVAFFIAPHNLVPGGVFGLSVGLNQITGLPIGMISLAINVPLLLLGFWMVGASFGVKTLVSLILSSAFIDGIMYFIPSPLVTSDILVSALFGGALIGLGVAVIITAGGTTGGTDIIAAILRKKFNLSIGRGIIIVDGIILAFGFLIFRDLELATYSVIGIIAISRTIDVFLNGMSLKKIVLVMSDKHEEIRQDILANDFGGSLINGSGMFYPDNEKKIILSALDRKGVIKVVHIAKEIDPDVFITIINAADVIGRGFKNN